MTGLLLAYSIVMPTTVGFLFVMLFDKSVAGSGFFEKICMGFGIGTGLLTFEMFLMGLMKIPYTGITISLVQGATLIILLVLCARSRLSLNKSIDQFVRVREVPGGRRSYFSAVLIVFLSSWILAKIYFVFNESIMLPVNTADSWSHWSAGAKFFFYEKGLNLDPSSEFYFGRGYWKAQRYPLHIALLQAWTAFCLGHVNEFFMKIWNALFYVSMIGLVFFAVKKEASTVVSLVSASFLAAVPLLTYHALTAYADLPLAYYALGATLCFRNYMTSMEKEDNSESTGLLVLAGVFLSFAAWTKMEGLFFVIAFSLALVLFQVSRRASILRLAAFGIPLAVVLVLWYSFLLVSGSTISYGEGNEVVETIKGGLHLEVLPIIAKQIFLSANFNIIFILLVILFIVGIRIIKRSDLRYLYIALYGVMGLFLLLYITTGNYRWVMNLTAINRNILTFVPMMYYIVTLSVVKLMKEETMYRK